MNSLERAPGRRAARTAFYEVERRSIPRHRMLDALATRATCAFVALALFAPPRAAARGPCPPGDPVLAEVGTVAVGACDVRRHLVGSGGLDAAIRAALIEAALALEARAVLGDEAAGLSTPEAARRVSARLFDPAQRCATIPETRRLRRYTDTRWRFVAPPAWVVDDLQVLCCDSPRACEDPDVTACITATRALAEELRERLPDRVDAETLTTAFDQALADSPRLALRRYAFYFDPDRPDAPIDPKLQEVDREIAEAASALSPGDVSAVVTSRFGHHVLRLHGARPAIDLRWDDPRTQALLWVELCPTQLESQRDLLASDLLEALQVTVDRAAVEAALTGAP